MFELRRADEAELDALAELEAACFAKPWSAAQLASLVQPREASDPCAEWALLAWDEGVLAAYIAWQCVLDTAGLLRVAVRPELRRRGLARRLFAASLPLLEAAGICCLQLEVSEKNTAALAFYKTERFRVSARRKDYYGPDEAALLLDRAWLDSGSDDCPPDCVEWPKK